MTRYRDDFDSRSPSPSRTCTRRWREVLAGARPAPAPRRRDREVRARDLLLQRRPRGGVAPARRGCWSRRPRDVADATTRSRRWPPASSPSASARRWSGDGYSFAVVNFANPDMVGHTGVIPAVVKAVETADACLGAGRGSRRAPRRRHAGDGRPRQRRDDARGGRHEPAHGAHDEPGAACRHGPRGAACAKAGS